MEKLKKQRKKQVMEIAESFVDVCQSREGGFSSEKLRSYLLSIGYCPIDCTTSTIGYLEKSVFGENKSSRCFLLGCYSNGQIYQRFAFINTELCTTEEEIVHELLMCIAFAELGINKNGLTASEQDELDAEADCFLETVYEKIGGEKDEQKRA